MRVYPSDRTDRPVPGKDVVTMSLDACRADSNACPFCHDGWATNYNPRYSGKVIEFDASDLRRAPKRVLMRSVCFCSCTMGRKVQALNQATAKDVYMRVPDIYDVASGRLPNWQLDDPSERPATLEEIEALPSKFREQVERISRLEFDREA